jgi:hypothetical protein
MTVAITLARVGHVHEVPTLVLGDGKEQKKAGI